MEQPAAHIFQTIARLILASASPRRIEMLRSVGLQFDVIPSRIAEEALEGALPRDAALDWARKKAAAVGSVHKDAWVLAADTIVVLDDEILGKPLNVQDACNMLQRLSGRTHRVITGICLLRQQRKFCRMEPVETTVRFKPLSPAEIRAYTRTAEPYDKAGAYGIQGMGAFMVESVHGSYTNVVGLPLCKTLGWLLEMKIIAPRDDSSLQHGEWSGMDHQCNR
jgi:septum formation protein